MSGTDAWVPLEAAADSECTRLYLATGLISLGETRLSELGLGASAEHPRLGSVRNPWNTDYTAGGSSSGSAALVAAGAVPIAHGNDGGGSVRIPASCTGLVGLKPTRDRLPPDDKAGWVPLRLVTNGVLTRSVRDSKQRLHIAVIPRSDKRECSPELRELTLKSADLLEELGHRVDCVEKLPVPSSLTADFRLYCALMAKWQVTIIGRAYGDTFDASRLSNLTLGLDRYARRNMHRLPLAIMRVRATRRRTAQFFGTYDAVLTPTLADETPRLGHLDPTADPQQIMDRGIHWNAFAWLQNITGEPAISLPLAESASGMPVGMMLHADVGREARLLE